MKLFSREWFADKTCGAILTSPIVILIGVLVTVFLGYLGLSDEQTANDASAKTPIFVETQIEPVQQLADESGQSFSVATGSPVLKKSTVVSEIGDDTERRIADPTSEVSTVSTSTPCPSGPPTQLRANARAIQMKPGYVKLLREPKIGLSDNDIGEIQKCEFVTILEGSTCAEQYNHYRVRTDDDKEGWAAEANNVRQKYWLVPVLDNKKCNLPPIFVQGEIATSDHPNSGFIRKEPTLDAATLSWTILKGDTVKIMDGPICNDTYIWYKVHGDKHPEPGWTELGKGNDYWFDIPDRIKATNVEDADASCP